MRLLTLLSVVLIGATISMDAYAQQRFFTLSGGSKGDTANAKHESQISELRSRADARDACGTAGMLYGKNGDSTRHAKTDNAGCIQGFKIDAEGQTAVTGNAVISGDVIVDGKKVQDHALSETLTCTDNQKLTWSGTSWTCTEESDPKVGNLVSGKWCAESGGQIVCNQEKPSNDLELDLALEDSLINGVRDFARKGGTLASCQGGEILISDGTTLKCVSLDTVAAGTLILDDLSDVATGLPATEDLLYFNGTNWAAGSLVEPFAKASIDGLTSGRCQIGEVLTFNGDQLTCVSDIGGPNDSLVLEDMADVSGTSSVTATNVMYFDGTYWKAAAESDSTVSSWAKLSTPITNLNSGQCDAGYLLTFDGTQLTCVLDGGGSADTLNLTDIADVSITTAIDDQVLAYKGGVWVNQTETDPTVESFAQTTLPTCAAGNILTSDGTSFSCVADADSAAGNFNLDDLADVSITTATNHDLIVYNGSGFVNKAGAVCSASEVLTYDGTNFTCVNVANSGLWTNNTTYISRGSAHVVNDAQALPAALTGAGTRQLWYPSKAAFRAGIVTGAEWDNSNIGFGSIAMGNGTTASGGSSVAMGHSATASGNNTVAIGLDTTAFDVTANNVMSIMGGSVGVNTVNPAAALEVSGTIIISNGGEVCDASIEGGIRYNAGNIEICDGSTWNGISAGSADWYTISGIPTGVQNISNTELTTAELTQLQNIDGTEISATQFGYLGAMDQSVSTTSDVAFNALTLADRLDVAADVSVTGTVQAAQFIGDGSLLTGLSSTLNSLTDVSTSMVPTDGQTLTFDNAAGEWVATTAVAGAESIDDLSDGRHDTDDFSSLFLGNGAGVNDDGTTNNNLGIGLNALASTTSGSNNTVVGVSSLVSNTTGNSNVAIGRSALSNNISGSQNIAMGTESMDFNTVGHNNLSLGYRSQHNSTGSYNVSLGHEANRLLTTGSNNIAIGASVTVPNVSGSNQLSIGNTIYGDLSNDKLAIGANVTGVTAGVHATVDISGTIKVAGTGAEVCDSANEGSIRFNPTTGRLQYCRP